MAIKTTLNSALSTAALTVSVTVDGVGPFYSARDGDHGTLVIYNADGTPAKVTLSTDAVVGFQAAVTEDANTVFAANPNGQAIVDEIVAETNAV